MTERQGRFRTAGMALLAVAGISTVLVVRAAMPEKPPPLEYHLVRITAQRGETISSSLGPLRGNVRLGLRCLAIRGTQVGGERKDFCLWKKNPPLNPPTYLKRREVQLQSIATVCAVSHLSTLSPCEDQPATWLTVLQTSGGKFSSGVPLGTVEGLIGHTVCAAYTDGWLSGHIIYRLTPGHCRS